MFSESSLGAASQQLHSSCVHRRLSSLAGDSKLCRLCRSLSFRLQRLLLSLDDVSITILLGVCYATAYNNAGFFASHAPPWGDCLLRPTTGLLPTANWRLKPPKICHPGLRPIWPIRKYELGIMTAL
jgi:hypothetical protein